MPKINYMEKSKKLLQDLQNLLYSEFSYKKYNVFIVFDVLVLLGIAITIYKFQTASIIVFLGAVAVFVLALLFIFISKKSQLKHGKILLGNAFDNLRRNDYKKTFEQTFEAYEVTKNTKLLNYIFNLINVYRPDIDKQSKIFTLELDNLSNSHKTDKKLIEILRQILDAIENINRQKNILEKSEQKIVELRQEIALTDENELLTEFRNIISRYKQIIENGKEKIKFYEEKITNLLKIKHKIIISQKLIKAREELKRIEDELWADSFSDETQLGLSGAQNKQTNVLYNPHKIFPRKETILQNHNIEKVAEK
jgi:hypothetical protein